MELNAKIFVAGHRGMVGSAIVRRLAERGFSNVVVRSRTDLNLLDSAAVTDFMASERPDYVFVAAAKVGGILANNLYRGQFIYENLTIQNNLIHSAHMAGVQRLMFLGSSCIYPKLAPQPIKEDYLLTGLLEPTNEPYAIAKIAGIKMCEAYNAQYGRQYVSVMPTNLYGPNDSYDLNNSHVLPALIRKFHLAKLAHAGDVTGIAADESRYGAIPGDILQSLGLVREAAGALVKASEPGPVLLWGTGTPRREFLYVDDLAAACCIFGEIEIIKNGVRLRSFCPASNPHRQVAPRPPAACRPQTQGTLSDLRPAICAAYHRASSHQKRPRPSNPPLPWPPPIVLE